MPERILIFWNNIEAIVMTLFSFILLISFTTIITVIPSMLAIVYWIPKIKKEQVNVDHNGSWWKWLKSFINK